MAKKAAFCAVCHRKLKDPHSIKEGVGPKCKKKLDKQQQEELDKLHEMGLEGTSVPGGIQLELIKKGDRK